jgi:hypothetical protein
MRAVAFREFKSEMDQKKVKEITHLMDVDWFGWP